MKQCETANKLSNLTSFRQTTILKSMKDFKVSS